MKIAIINRHPNDVIGGSEIQCAGIARRLSDRGHQIYYIAPGGSNKTSYEANYTVVPVNSHASDIANAVLKNKPDIVYWRLNKYHFYRAVRKISSFNIPIVFAVSHISDTRPWSNYENMTQGIKQLFKGIKQGLLNLYNHQGFRYIEGVTVINPDHLGLLPIKQQCFVPNSITSESDSFSWPRPYIVWVSNIKPAKQPELYIKLAQSFLKQGIDFLMVGDIQFAEYDWIRYENSNTPNFYYLGTKNLKEVNGIIGQSLLLTHTCKPEGFGSVFIQAWLKGKPTISLAFDPGGYIESKKLGGYASNSWSLYVDIIRSYINSSNLRKSAGLSALEFSEHQFSASKTTDTLESFLKKIHKEN